MHGVYDSAIKSTRIFVVRMVCIIALDLWQSEIKLELEFVSANVLQLIELLSLLKWKFTFCVR